MLSKTMSGVIDNIPEKCLTCPFVLGAVAEIHELERQREDLLEKAFSDEPEELARNIVEKLEDFGEGRFKLSEEGLTRAFLNATDECIKAMDEEREVVESAINQFTSNCAGKLALRNKFGSSIYTVSICTSPEAPYDDEGLPAPVHREDAD